MNTLSIPRRACLWLFLLAGWPGAEALPPAINRLPTGRILEPAAGASFASGASVPIRVDAVDPDGYVPHIEFYVDGKKVGEQTLHFFVAPPPGEVQRFEHVWIASAPGAHRISFLVTDNLGGTADGGVGILVKANAENVRPKVSILEPKVGARYPVGDTVPIVVEATDPDGYIPHIEYFVDGKMIGEETLRFLVAPPPGQVQQFKWPWRGALPGTHRIVVSVTDDRGGQSEAVREVQVGDKPVLIHWVKAGSEWRYQAKNQDLGESWVQPGYGDQDWPVGPAQLGFGDGDEATLIPAAKPLQPTVYFRRSFDVAASAGLQRLLVRLVRDDGAVVWLNGKRLLADNMPDGPIKFATLAAGSAGDIENAWHEFEVSPELLVVGRNQLAVEVHQVNLTSSDVSFDLELIGLLQPSTAELPLISIEATSPGTSEPCPVCRVTPGVFTVRRTGDAREGLVVGLSYAGSATPVTDYVELPARVEFPAGQSAVEIRVGAFDDALVEGDETVVATLTAPLPGSLPAYRIDSAHSHAVVVIHDDDSGGNVPVVGIRTTRAETTEPSCLDCLIPPPAPGVFAVRRLSGDLALALEVQYEITGTAKTGVDYRTLSGTATIPAGHDSVDVEVHAAWDQAAEGDETVVLTLQAVPAGNGFPKYRIIQDGQGAKLVIHDHPPVSLPLVSVEATQPTTSEGCPACLVLPGRFTLTRTGSSVDGLTVMLSYAGTAQPGIDYEKLPMLVEFPAGKSSIDLLVLARYDQIAEGEESVVATVEADPTDSTDGALPHYRVDADHSSAKVVIHDSPEDGLVPVVSVEVSRGEISECPPQAFCKIPPVEIVFRRTTPRLADPLTIPITWSGSASWPGDYLLGDLLTRPESITFAAGSDTVKLLLNAVSDCLIEPVETIVVEIQPDASLGPIGRYRVNAGRGAAKVAILDGSQPENGRVAVVGIRGGGSSPEMCPPNADCRTIEFVLTRKGGDLAQPLTVNLRYAGTALPGVDFTALPKTATFPAGQDLARVGGVPIDDSLLEGDETVVATVVCSGEAATDYRIDGGLASATVTILDDDISAGEAVVQILEPKSGAVFSRPESIFLKARTRDPRGAMTHLDWFAGELKLGASDIFFIRAPDPGTEIVHEFSWKNPPAGVHKVYAVGSNAAGQRVVSPAVLVTVLRDEERPVVTVVAGVAETREVPPGSKMALIPGSFVLRRTGSAAHSLKVFYAIGGTAKNGRDYGFLDGDATFAAGEVERVIYVAPITDELVEGDESVELSILANGAYSIGTPQSARVVIHDAQSLSEPQISWVEPKDGTRLEAGGEIKLVVTTMDPAGYFGEVEFRANGRLIGRTPLVLCLGLNCEPVPGSPITFSFLWKNVEPGDYVLTATGLSFKGHRVESAPIHITVARSEGKPFVIRTLPVTYQPGVPFRVNLLATPPTTVGGYGVEDHPPRGWLVTQISEGGVWDAIHGAVKFGPFLDGKERKLQYDVTPASDGVAAATFEGLASLDGTGSRIGGDQVVSSERRQHPADANPSNWSLSLNEATAYGAAWRAGMAWAIGPNPIPLDYVTRAGALWRGGELYTYDPSAGPAPLSWVNISAAGLRPVALDFDLPPAEFAENLKLLRGRQSFALAEMVSDAGGTILRVRTLPGDEVRAQAIEGIIPVGASVDNVSDGGVVDATRRVIRWGPFFDAQARTLSARVTGSEKAAGFARASFDGESRALVAGVASSVVASGPRIAEVRPLADGTVQLFVVDAGAAGCVLEYTDDLVTWHPMDGLSAGLDCQVHHDTDANESAQRYYRAARR